MQEFRRQGLRFPVEDGGPPTGPAVLLLHGFPQNGSAFRGLLPVLQAAGMRTLVPAQRGYAAGCRPPRRRDYRMRELVADVVGLVGAAGVDRVHLVGHDWGGAVAWAVAGGHPELVRSLTVLSMPHPAAFGQAMWRSDQLLRSWYIGLFQLPWLPEKLLARSLATMLTRSGLPTAEVDRYCAMSLDPAGLTAALNWYRALPWAGPPVGPIMVPTTYVWGNRDFALGRAAAVGTGGQVTADYRFLELEAGHWLPETRADRIAAAVLDRVNAPS